MAESLWDLEPLLLDRLRERLAADGYKTIDSAAIIGSGVDVATLCDAVFTYPGDGVLKTFKDTQGFKVGFCLKDTGESGLFHELGKRALKGIHALQGWAPFGRTGPVVDVKGHSQAIQLRGYVEIDLDIEVVVSLGMDP